ncbi:MAG: 2OG-Fe dioxygenase family protein, partial [Steroidobacteraceae bacterium]
RWFEPIETTVLGAPAWGGLVRALGNLFATVRAVPRWYIEAHQFRIDSAEGIGRPTPEGAHRDGVDYVAVILVNRNDVSGGETRVFDAQGPAGVRFTMVEPWTALLLDDAQVVHETTPIQKAGPHGVRDTLVLTFRADRFQAP